ncbi:MAG: DegV family EDD domain-containing protein [Lachnospiraceae bacterium]|nr:DegV family EDD domain-containing protein [Lachnospiraceae bacterium]
MKIVNFFNYVRDAIRDPHRELYERVFLIFSCISEVGVIFAFIGDLIVKENPVESALLVLVGILVPSVSFTCLYLNKVRFASIFLVTSVIFVVLPVLFFYGGALQGGGILWVIFAYIYVGLAISGSARRILLATNTVVTLVLYYLSYAHPEWVTKHTPEVAYVDSFISMVLVGFVCFFMTWVQNRLMQEEKERAEKEAERAEALTRSQNRFFSSMSHEIRTPINSILGLNELILRDQNASDDILKEAAGIQGAGKMLLALINDILDFSKMEAGSMDIVPVDYHPGELISEVVNMVWLKAEEKGLRFRISIDPNVPSVLYGDEVRLKQVIVNILNNAVKYTNEGSVDLHIESENLDDKTAVLTISVTDTGMGIKKEALPFLFDAFKRVDEEKNRHIEGTGLGLSIVKQLVELMGGNITVNSVYGEGSTFTVTVKQGISDMTAIGELSIHSAQQARAGAYESRFKAPDARILIVDDNEMNLEVERRLLLDTDAVIDTAMSGKEALELTVNRRYDVILMDHLMPGMDGIDCLERIRHQAGGMNRITPVVVLTANAGSENRSLYTRSGFDGYLVKPVSGEALEDTLMKYIAREKLVATGKLTHMREDINVSAGYSRKVPVIITSTSMCDLPDEVVQKLGIPIMPFLIHTDEGVFKDGIQMDANELIRYISRGGNVHSSPPDVRAYTEFFAASLRHAHHLIHIAITTGMSKDYERACEAARTFDNVTVIGSGMLSSATGLLVLVAQKLAQQDLPVAEIVKELESVKDRLRCTFVVDNTEYMAHAGLVNRRIDSLARSLNLHLCLKVKNNRTSVGGLWLGKTRHAYKKYIHKAFPVDIIPESEVVFITYADVPMETLLWIKEEVSKLAYFENVVFQQASAAISSNCGPGTFGVLYFVKSNKSYNISAFLNSPHEELIEEEEPHPEKRSDPSEDIPGEESVSAPAESPVPAEQPWYLTLDCIDGQTAIASSGSEDALRSVLRIFHDSVPAKSEELNGYYRGEDWENYTIKIHALKSSARLIGATALSEEAAKLEAAGKEGNVDYIRAGHEGFMQRYAALGEQLTEALFSGEKAAEEPAKPLADAFLMKSVYEGLKEAAEAMDGGTIEEILKEMEDYAVPEEEAERFEAIRGYAARSDYDAILAALSEK